MAGKWHFCSRFEESGGGLDTTVAYRPTRSSRDEFHLMHDSSREAGISPQVSSNELTLSLGNSRFICLSGLLHVELAETGSQHPLVRQLRLVFGDHRRAEAAAESIFDYLIVF